ncbi:glycoside hydrolase family 17 protein [Macrolepiota fuliginosa MF-IS2]|uniref:glucan endo-1,3-beta-D-glucosidase n=1 Tax=Macrolepiota fuliginosa MF-IS2 TaxID=1400762 RepID=A0A9P5WZ43_9AGAR|nr:glycoside hydrolase family 17 protein [Macrolepiota fuliginosa MF-IS2]
MNSFLRTCVRLLFAIVVFRSFSGASPVNSTKTIDDDDEQENNVSDRLTGCFPGIGFQMPQSPPSSLDGWWCNLNSEYAFVGFSYEVEQCQSFSTLKRDFTDIKQRFRGRYVRIYGACDRKGFYDDVINAAWQTGIGIHALIWFGFNGGSAWKTRRDALVGTLYSNRLAKFVVRVVQFGSEPLFDGVLSPNDLAEQVRELKARIGSLRIQVTVSDMAYSYQKSGEARSVMSAIDIIDVHMLPFFANDASTARNAWPIVQRDLNWFIQNGEGKKIYFSQNGWPSVTYPGVEPNSKNAVANVQNERDYYNLLDAHCSYLKSVPGGGVGWFAHIYSDNQEPGYGIYDTRGNLKFPFSPRVTC